jgi:uncharacterized protein
MDDLGDYRPGLDAARERGVRHPFVEAGIDKSAVRSLARDLGLGTIADLPASPCLSSRVETGLWIRADWLSAIDTIERLVQARTSAETVRCRITAKGARIELDPSSLAALSTPDMDMLAGEIRRTLDGLRVGGELEFASYQRGSAFLHSTVRVS